MVSKTLTQQKKHSTLNVVFVAEIISVRLRVGSLEIFNQGVTATVWSAFAETLKALRGLGSFVWEDINKPREYVKDNVS